MTAGRFGGTEADDILVVQDLGRMELSRGPGRNRAVVNLRKLALLRLGGTGLRPIWQSEPLNTTTASSSDIAGTSWTAGDINNDGRQELLLFTADTVKVLSFASDTATVQAFGTNGAWIEAAACCDADSDSVTDIAALEVSQLDSGLVARLLRLYRLTASGLVPVGPYSIGLDRGEARVALLGSARLEDYPGVLPIVATIYSTLKPSLYEVLYRPKPDSLVLSDNPFPWQEWFAKTRVLPAGELTLFDVGDTLVAYGYFVPGLGTVPVRGESPLSFAALEDGEWRLLPLAEHARRISGPVTRFTRDRVAGWLELRDNLFYFYPGEVFRWR